MEIPIEKMNTDITPSAKPSFSNVIDNFNTEEYLRIAAWTGIPAILVHSLEHSYGMTPRLIRGVPNVVAGGLIGLLQGSVFVYLTTEVRMRFSPNQK